MKTWIKNFYFVFITAVTCLSVNSFAATAKKNVCAMTINSSDEIDLFKKHLSKDQFNFIELTETEDKGGSSGDDKASISSNPWLKASCRQGIKCDVLVISGHFGGAFFGNSNINLPLEELESASCDSACSGILHEPKEVFLFGCNTLAGKERDSRTPEQYAQVLMDDGFSETQAQQIAAFRYSAIGSSFSDRMSRIFAKVPRIYGFTSIAPSGKTVAPHLTRYLKDSAPTYFEQLTNMTATPNTALKERLKGQPLSQISGTSNTNTPVCYIKSEKTSTIGKLRYVLEVLEKGGALELAPYLSEYFEKLDEKSMNPAERRLLENVYENTAGREKLAAFVAKPIKGLLKPQVDTLNLMYNINWMNLKDYNQRMDALVMHPLYNKETLLNRELVDQMCSLDAKVRGVDVHRIPADFWNKYELYSILSCLKAENTELMEKVSVRLPHLAQALKDRANSKRQSDLETLRAILSILSRSENLSAETTERLVGLLEVQDLIPHVAVFAEEALLKSQPLRLAFEKYLAGEKAKSTLYQVVSAAILSLSRDEEQFILSQYEDFIAGRGKPTSYSFLTVLKKSPWFRDRVLRELVETKNDVRLRSIMKLLNGLYDYTGLYSQRFTEIVLDESFASNTRMIALEILSATQQNTTSFTSLLKKIATAKTAYQVRVAAWGYFRNSSANIASETASMFANETHPVMKKVFERYTIPYNSNTPYVRHQMYHLGQADTKSPLTVALQTGKEPYALVPKRMGGKPVTGNFEVRSIIMGVDEATVKENDERSFASFMHTRVLYDVKRNSILGTLGDIIAIDDESNVEIENMLFTQNEVDDVVFLGTALQMDLESGKIVQDYSESLHKVQSDIYGQLIRNPDYKKYIERYRYATFKVSQAPGQDMNIAFYGGDHKNRVTATGTLHFTPGPNGKGTVQIKNVQTEHIEKQKTANTN